MSDSRSLRQLILVCLWMAIVTALGTSTIILWPVWEDYRERQAIEPLLKQVRLGATDSGIPADVGAWDYSFDFQLPRSDGHFDGVEITAFRRKYHWYCVVKRKCHTTPTSAVVLAIEAYRIEKPPASYESQTGYGRQNPPTTLPIGYDASEMKYLIDFGVVLAGQAESDLKLPFELLRRDSVADPGKSIKAAEQDFSLNQSE